MENLYFEPTHNTPLINCDGTSNIITIAGESRPENVRAFYSNVFTWIDTYEKSLFYLTSFSKNEKIINLNFKLDYFNSSSLKVFMEIIPRLHNISKSIDQVKLNINWYYDEDDDDMLDSGKEFEKMTGVTMNYTVNS
jgi:hypothetical protein